MGRKAKLRQYRKTQSNLSLLMQQKMLDRVRNIQNIGDSVVLGCGFSVNGETIHFSSDDLSELMSAE